MALFTDDELSQAMCLKVVKPPPGNPDGVHLEFYGRITIAAMQGLRLDPLDHQILSEPINSAADLLQSLEIIFRRHAEQHHHRGNPSTGHQDDAAVPPR